MPLSEIVPAQGGTRLELGAELERLHGAPMLRKGLRLDEPEGAALIGVTEHLRDAILLVVAARRFEPVYRVDGDDYGVFLKHMMGGPRARLLQARLKRDHEDKRLLAYAVGLILDDLASLARHERRRAAFEARGLHLDATPAILESVVARLGGADLLRPGELSALDQTAALMHILDRAHDRLAAALNAGPAPSPEERSVLQALSELAQDAQMTRPLDELEAGRHIRERCRDEARRDLSSLVVTEFLLVMVEFVDRVNDPAFVEGWVKKDLIKECLRSPIPAEHSPRRLRTVLVDGELLKLPDGDQDELRGLRTLTREDQMPEVIPEELAPWCSGSSDPTRAKTGRFATMQLLLNEQPLIFEYSTMRKPVVRHRMLLVFLMDLEPAIGAAGAHGAELTGGRLAFELLVTAGLVTPHALVHADVAFFQWRHGSQTWGGRFFALRSLDLTTRKSEGWRNLVAVDRCLPEFFVRHEYGGRAQSNRLVQELQGGPDHHLRRLCESGRYESVCTAVVVRGRDEERALAREALLLPSVAQARPSVLLCQALDGEEHYRSQTFADFASARELRHGTARARREHILETYATLLIGERSKRGRS